MHTSLPEPVAHRDLKPGNIMMDHDFTPVIIDFGNLAVHLFRLECVD